MTRSVFLSAGIPDQPDRGPYVDTSDPVAIRDAVRALAGVSLCLGYELVFGGHPAISPLVRQVAEGLDKANRVVVYQSRFFADRIPEETRRIRDFRWTEANSSREQSLEIMRWTMLNNHPFAFGVFVGGMDGVESEYAMFCERFDPRSVVAAVVASTGGAARILAAEHETRQPPHLSARLAKDYRYQSLFRDLLTW